MKGTNFSASGMEDLEDKRMEVVLMDLEDYISKVEKLREYFKFGLLEVG